MVHKLVKKTELLYQTLGLVPHHQLDQETMAAQDKLVQRQPVVDRLMEKDCRECSIHQACSR